MKKEQVPQDQSNLSKNNLKELCYAVNNDGKYTTELSTGWEPKSIALEQSMAIINERINDTLDLIKEGKSSPIAYYMEINKMDWPTLASYMNMWTWRVKRHNKPNIFNKLNTKTLTKYAEVFNITVEQLTNFKPNGN